MKEEVLADLNNRYAEKHGYNHSVKVYKILFSKYCILLAFIFLQFSNFLFYYRSEKKSAIGDRVTVGSK